MTTKPFTAEETLSEGAPASGASLAEPAALPAEVCGYGVRAAMPDRTGSPGTCLLGMGPGGRSVVLKRLDPDCLLKGGKGKLHPNVRERLGRVRELAHAGVANLYGVEREGDAAWLIWEHLPGRPFAEYAGAPGRSPLELATAARELILTVESLHMQGIVHGALTSGNVIVAPSGALRLTHVSPYLYTDRSEDAQAVFDLLDEAANTAGEGRSPLAALLAESREGQARGALSLLPLAGRLATFIAARSRSSVDSLDVPAAGRRDDAGPRHRALAGAAAATILGLAAAWGAWRAAGRPSIQPPKSVPANVDAQR